MTTARDGVLERIRGAQRTRGEQPGFAAAPLFEPVVDLESRFREELLALKGELIEPGEGLRSFLRGFQRIATDGSELVRAEAGAASCDVRAAELGITTCEFLIAGLGAVVLSARSAGGRSLSVLPPTHLVIARRDQLVSDLATALRLLHGRYEGTWPSALSVIAGPSRTGDIEKVLVLGAHGPRRLVVCLVE